MTKEKYPEGHFIGKWMAIGIVLGAGFAIPLGLTIGNPAFFGIGLPIGLAIGVAIGSAKEKEAKAQGLIRPLTKEEKRRKEIGTYAGIGAVIVGLIVLLAVFLLGL